MLSLIVLTLRQKQLHLYVEDDLLPFCDFVVDSVEYLGQFFVDFISLCKVLQDFKCLINPAFFPNWWSHFSQENISCSNGSSFSQFRACRVFFGIGHRCRNESPGCSWRRWRRWGKAIKVCLVSVFFSFCIMCIIRCASSHQRWWSCNVLRWILWSKEIKDRIRCWSSIRGFPRVGFLSFPQSQKKSEKKRECVLKYILLKNSL